MLGSPCSPCCGCNPQDIVAIYNLVRSRPCVVSLTHDLRWQQAATQYVTRSGTLDLVLTADSNGSPGHALYPDTLTYNPPFTAGWCNSGATVPQLGDVYLGKFDTFPAIEKRNDGFFYYVGTNTRVGSGNVLQLGQGLYRPSNGALPGTIYWNAIGSAADRSCQRQINQLANSVLTVYEQTTTPGTESLALNPAQSAVGAGGAVVTFVKDAPTFLVTATITIGAATATNTPYPGTNCGVGASVQVSAKFRRGSNTAPTVPTLTVQPSYTAQQARGLLPWINVPGCKAWIDAPYYTTNPAFPGGPATDTSPFASLTPWWDYDLLAQQGIPVSFTGVNSGVPNTSAFYRSGASVVSFLNGIQFALSSFSGSGFAMRWIDYGGGGAPLWRTGWTFSEDMVNPNASSPCDWLFAGTSQPATRQYARTSDVGSISSATVTLS